MKTCTWLSLTVMVALVLVATPAPAVELNFTFDSGLGPNFEFVQVNTTDVYLDDGNDELRIYSPGISGVNVRGGDVKAKFTIQGDFDVTVDFTIYQPLLSWQQVELHPYGVNVFYVVRDVMFSSNNYHVWDGSNDRGTDYRNDTSGTLRVERIGTRIYGYFWDTNSNDWHLLHDEETSAADVHLGLMAQNNLDQTGSFNVAFDNLTITADNIIGLVPLPPSLWMAGAGLLGLMGLGWRRRRS